MIETEQSVMINAGLDQVWDFASDIRSWASLMPGMQACDIIDEDNSRWTLKVGVGGLVRTVKLDVHVDQWDGPGRAVFTYKLQGDPVQGGGSYVATTAGPNETAVKLLVQVRGSGPMAPMWEAMGRPLLPQLAKGFADQFKQKIEAADRTNDAASVASTAVVRPSGFAAGKVWLRSVWKAIFGGAHKQR